MYALWIHARDINNQAQADAVIAQARVAGITDLLFQVIDDLGRAHYNTTLFTKCPDVGSFDPLGYLAQQPGLRAHAWLCVGADVLRVHPEWNVRVTKGLDPAVYVSWLDFTLAAAREFVAGWCNAIVTAYPTIGIHLDYMRWHNKFGGDKLPWATTTDITRTVEGIHNAISASTILTAAVAWSPLGLEAGSLQAWGEWIDWLTYAFPMAYVDNVPRLQYIMAKSASMPRSKMGIGLSGRNFDVTPDVRVGPQAIADMVNWAQGTGYNHFAWFDYTKIDPQQYAVIAQFAPQGGVVMSAVQDLDALAVELETQATQLRTEASTLDSKAAQVRAIADDLRAADALADQLAAAL